MNEPILCYVDGHLAYVTTQSLQDQDGYKWDMSPYEFNAEPPYKWEQGEAAEPWEIVQVAWDAEFSAPGAFLCSVSVREINEGRCPWLKQYMSDDAPDIPAGTTLSEFTRIILAAGGKVFREVDG